MPEFGGEWGSALTAGQTRPMPQFRQTGHLRPMFCSAAELLAAILHSIAQKGTRKLEWKFTRIFIPKL
jgi:hypothetical protein